MNQSKRLEKKLASFVKSARKYENLTQVQLAKKAKTKQEGISRIEKGECSVELAEKCLNAMGYELIFHHVSFRKGNTTRSHFLGY